MIPKIKRYWIVIMVIIAAITIPGTALLTAGTKYQDAYLWVFVVWLIAYGLLDAYSRRGNKNR